MKKIAIASLLITMTFLPSVYAETCGDIMWSPEMSKTFPHISMACLKTKEKDGQTLILVKADLVRVVTATRVELDVHLNDGSKERAIVDTDGIKINGNTDFNELPPGYELSIYFPAGKRFQMIEVNSDVSKGELIAVEEPPTI